MPDLGALLWPRTVALIGASADAESLRGRIFNVMRGHAFAGQLIRQPQQRRGARLRPTPASPTCRSRPTSPSSSSPPSTYRRSSSAAARPACAPPSC